MKMTFLIGGAKYINFNHSEFQQVWWNAREKKDDDISALLIQIAKYSPGAFNRNSRFLRKLFYQADMWDLNNKTAFYCAAKH